MPEAWVAGIQEEIKDCRSGRGWFLVLMTIGLLFAVSPLFIELVVAILATLANQPPPTPSSEYFIWSIPIGVAVAIGGVVGALYYDNKIKKLRAKLTEGKPRER